MLAAERRGGSYSILVKNGNSSGYSVVTQTEVKSAQVGRVLCAVLCEGVYMCV